MSCRVAEDYPLLSFSTSGHKQSSHNSLCYWDARRSVRHTKHLQQGEWSLCHLQFFFSLNKLAHMRTEIVKILLNWGHGREYIADQLHKKRKTARSYKLLRHQFIVNIGLLVFVWLGHNILSRFFNFVICLNLETSSFVILLCFAESNTLNPSNVFVVTIWLLVVMYIEITCLYCSYTTEAV